MELHDFKIGDHVVLIKRQDDAEPGVTGIVRGIEYMNSGTVQVEIDNEFLFDSLHTCEGLISSRHGYNIQPERLELIKPIKLIKLSKAKRNAKIKKIIKEIKANKSYHSCFKNISKEVNSWSDIQIDNYKLG